MRTWCLSLVFFLGLTAPGFAQDWAKSMFSETTHDFGTVARGAKVEYQFTIENIYEEEIRISACYPSCECVNPQLDKRTLKTWDKAVLTATVDTKGFYGQRDVTITVKFEPFPAEVQLHVHAYIRSDVVVQPEEVQFGTVKLGSSMQQQVRISYAGRRDWKIVQVESSNSALEGQVVETARVGNKVSYDLVATIKDSAPVGYIKDNLFLVTNDRNAQTARVPVPVEAIVASPLTVRPNPLFLGVVKKGESTSKPLVVQSKTSVPAPFHITGVRCDDPRFSFKIPSEAKINHLLPITFTATDEAGRFTVKLLVETDMPNTDPVEVMVNVQVPP
jgi:hypothetical protein